MCEVLDRVENKGVEKGVDNMRKLMRYLISHNRMDDLKRLSEDASYEKELMNEVFPSNA